MRFSQKRFLKFLPFQMNVIIFQCNASAQKMNTPPNSNNSVTYPEKNFSFQRNTCAFLTEVFHEILTLSNERDYLSI